MERPVNFERGIFFNAHTRYRLRMRRISEEQIRRVLVTFQMSYPAEPLPGASYRSIVYIGFVDGRELKVYVREDSDPPEITSVSWRGRN